MFGSIRGYLGGNSKQKKQEEEKKGIMEDEKMITKAKTRNIGMKNDMIERNGT